jgi:hypothetical protein
MPRAYEFLCIDLFAGRADEDELFRTHAKFWERAEVLHGVAAREANESTRTVEYWVRMIDGGR